MSFISNCLVLMYRNAADFWFLILYSTFLVNLLSKVFCVIFWELYIYDHIIFKQIIRLFSLQFGCFLFVFLDVLLWLELLLHY